MIDSAAALAAARRALRGLQGPGHEAVAAAAARGTADKPLFVERLDQPERSYYLAHWRDARGVVLVVQIDATNGTMRSYALLPTPVDHLVLPKEQARSLVAAARGAATEEPRLVWLPCRESTSPLQPLYRVPTGGGEAYVTASGSIHDRLTPMEKGG